MPNSILEAARRDMHRIVTSGGFSEAITLTTPDGMLSVEVTGLADKHHQSFDSDGLQVSSKTAHVTVSEADLTALFYPVRDARNEVALKKHKVSVQDSTGVLKNYVVKDHFPNETLGAIVLILGDWH